MLEHTLLRELLRTKCSPSQRGNNTGSSIIGFSTVKNVSNTDPASLLVHIKPNAIVLDDHRNLVVIIAQLNMDLTCSCMFIYVAQLDLGNSNCDDNPTAQANHSL